MHYPVVILYAILLGIQARDCAKFVTHLAWSMSDNFFKFDYP
jgi:hypothetical protein